jgi:signal transduction histidine kinase
MASRAGIEIVTSQPPNNLTAYANADRLHQVLLNVIHNAIQAIGGPGRVSVRCRGENGSVLVEVDDTGPGFPADGLQQAFAPFVTSKTAGAGLGLAISKAIIEEHGGTMGVENLHPNGARVWFRLPTRSETA